MLLTVIQAAIFVSYVGFLLYRFRKPLPSISDSWYELEEPTRWLFTLFCWSLGGIMLFQGTETTPLFFLSGTGLMFVGAATQFKWSGAHTNLVHYGGALVGIMGGLCGLGVEYGNWTPLLAWSFGTLALRVAKIENFTWWVEILAFVSIISGFLLRD
jgi:hypothetical protein